MNREFILAVEDLEREKDISKDLVIDAIEAALVSAYKKNFDSSNVRVDIDRNTGDVHVFMVKNVVSDEDVMDEYGELTIDEAKEFDENAQIGDVIEVEVTPKDFGRIAAQTAKQVVVQKIREAERGLIYDDFSNRQSEIFTGIIQRVSNETVFVNMGRTEGILAANEQVPGEVYEVNSRIRVYIMDVKRTTKGPQVYLSRSHPGLVKRLFELEVPEIRDGIVEIRSISREAGSRTKMAVSTLDPDIDPVGSCVGPRGSRVQAVVDELFGEKIDIINWSDKPAELVSSALSPAKVEKVYINEEDGSAVVVVPDFQLSLAIGKEGQNVRLAAKLCGWKIDIKSHTQFEEAGGEEQLMREREEAAARAAALSLDGSGSEDGDDEILTPEESADTGGTDADAQPADAAVEIVNAEEAGRTASDADAGMKTAGSVVDSAGDEADGRDAGEDDTDDANAVAAADGGTYEEDEDGIVFLD